MARKFNVANDFAGSLSGLTTAYKTQITIAAAAATLRRGRIVEIAVGPVSNPANQDCNIIYTIQRFLGAGTGTSATPVWVGSQEGGSDAPVSGHTALVNHTVEPGYSAGLRLWTKALNQHSGFIWYSPDDLGLPWPAVSTAGLGCEAKGASSDYTGQVLWEVKYEE